jgi:hypothetical protein
MPGELSDPTQLFPYHYDTRYAPGTNQFEPGSPDFDGYLQSIASPCIGRKLNPEELSALKEYLDSKGFLNRNPGDQAFREKVECYLSKLKKLRASKKVARRWLTSIS